MESKKRNMTESMKFGPEWLRSATDNCNASNYKASSITSLTIPRYQLALYRYGREELLALFDHSYKAPDTLESFSTLYVDKPQLPLALIHMTEEETRLWNGGVSSSSGRGRGGNVDRGGRGGRGRGGIYSHPRGVGFDDSGEGSRSETQSYSSRGRPFERSQSERSWSERNGGTDSGDWNGSTSPRKDTVRGPSGSSLMENNWRRQRGNSEEDEGWRVTSSSRGEKWGRTNWREAGSDRDRGDGDTEEVRKGTRWEHRGNHRSNYDSSHHQHRTGKPWESNHHDNHDNLPEWVTENPGESGGSFDALGAFHGGTYSDDDEDANGHEPRHRRSSEGNSEPSKSQNISKINNHGNNNIEANQHPPNDKKVYQSWTAFDGREPSSQTSSTENATAVKSKEILKTSASEPKITNPKHVDEIEKKVEEIPSIIQKVVNIVEPQEPKITTESPHQRVPPPVMHDLKDVELMQTANAINQKVEFPLDKMKEEADALVAKLMADDNIMHKELHAQTAVTNQPSMDVEEKWFYRDPQGKVQGPFSAAVMAEWCKQGYFNANLLVRRRCDERYTTLGELISICGRVPFKPGPPILPLKANEPAMPIVPNPVASAMPPLNPMNKPGMENPLVMLQLQHLQFLQNQMMLGQMNYLRKYIVDKLSQSEQWSSMSPLEQAQMIAQYLPANSPLSEFLDVPVQRPMTIPTPPPNPVMQLINQMHQAKTHQENSVPGFVRPPMPTQPIDPIQQLMTNTGSGISNIPLMPSSNISAPPLQDDNPIKMLIRQLSNSNNHLPPMPADSLWQQPPPPHFASQFFMPMGSEVDQMGKINIDCNKEIYCSAIEREQQQQHLNKKNSEALEAKRKEELKKQKELKKKEDEELAKKKQEEEQAKLAEKNKKIKEEEKRRREEEKRRLEEEQKKKEEKKRKEEEKREEEKRRLEEVMRKKQDEEKKKKEEQRKQEEKKKKEEEKRKKMEEQAKLEAERIKNEEAMRKKAELEEQNRKAEQRKREAEALRKLQERSKDPWAQTQHTPSPVTHASLADIQRLEKEKKAEEQRLQQFQQQLAQQKAAEMAQETAAMDSSKRLQFKWAEKANSSEKVFVKSLAQIQQEEQEQIAKVKQQEKEKLEKVASQKNAFVQSTTGTWGVPLITMNCSTTNQAWSSTSKTTGFWEVPNAVKNNPPSKPATKQTPVKSATNATQSQQQPQLQQSPQQSQKEQSQQQLQSNSKANKSKTKKEDEIVKKLFEQNTAKTDDFTQWCNKVLAGLQVSVDIPTFVGFLRDIESPYEVKEYVRLYLGDRRQCDDFAKQFLEKRSKWRSTQRPQVQADDLCKPAPAVNPNTCTEFQEVKGKSKKPKKGKMFKVDNRILGFSVTSAPDRINVGDRDYGEGM